MTSGGNNFNYFPAN